MTIFNNRCSGGGASIGNVTQTLYIKNLIIVGQPGDYKVTYFPTLFQKLKSALGLYPSTAQIEKAVRKDILGEEYLR